MLRVIQYLAHFILVVGPAAGAGFSSDPAGALFTQYGYPRLGDVPVLNRKVFRGMRVSIMEHPYVVSVRRLRCHYLVGSLLTPNVVITVAHPLYNVSTLELGVVAGETYADRGAALHHVLAVLAHPRFDPSTLLADLALIRLYENLVFRASKKRIPIYNPKNQKFYRENKAFVTGWGRCDWTGQELCWPRSSIYHPDEKLDPMLRTVTFQFHMDERNDNCKSYEIHKVAVQPGMMCAGPARRAEPLAACLAVPGAPLVVRGQLVGLQSWGLGCGFTQDLPLVYTKLEYYLDWLTYNLVVLSTVEEAAIFELYRASRASAVREWLLRTRVGAETRAPRAGPITASAIDHSFLKLEGLVTDFRDYIDNGRYRAAKSELYQRLRVRANKLKSIKEIHDNLTTTQTYPFFATKTPEEEEDYVVNETVQPDFNADFFNKFDFSATNHRAADDTRAMNVSK